MKKNQSTPGPKKSLSLPKMSHVCLSQSAKGPGDRRWPFCKAALPQER